MTDFGADELRDFMRLRRMREGGYFESEGSVPMPEIVADGEGPDDGWLPGQAEQTFHCSVCKAAIGEPTHCSDCFFIESENDAPAPRPMGVTQYYCQDCGQKEDATGRCSNCWGGA